MSLLWKKAEHFLEQYYFEKKLPGLPKRLAEVKEAIGTTGSYSHTFNELSYGAKLAWRNSNRCIGRLFWKSLQLLDARKLTQPYQIKEAISNHLRIAYNGGKIKPLITVFPPKRPDGTSPVKIINHQLTRYAGYQTGKGKIIGDPQMLDFTATCIRMGWKGRQTNFDLLPIIIETEDANRYLFQLDSSIVKEVTISHPNLHWMENLGIKWYAVPAISNMSLLVGGIEYPAAPFNGWYMVTEIASRNLADSDRYNLLPIIAEKLGLSIDSKSPYWKDKALVELNIAVHYSFKKAGVTIVDHHTASDEFVKFMSLERKQNRKVTAEWSWIVPPLSGSATKVFHQDYEDSFKTPNFIYR